MVSSTGTPPRVPHAARLALGTAQFGEAYGISNRHGRPSDAEVEEILGLARTLGIDTIDTAAAYGDAEAVLGAAGTTSFQVISKLAPGIAPSDVPAAIDASLARLRRDRLDGLLVHRCVLGGEILELLAAMRADRRVSAVGVSAYHPHEVQWLLARHAPLDLIQAPCSLFDQRFVSIFGQLASLGIDVHARSVFLQGLYFLRDDELTGTLEPARAPLQRARALAARHDLPLAAMLLRYVAALVGVSRIVIGVDSAPQLLASAEAMKGDRRIDELIPELRALALTDERVLLPSHWRR